MSTGVLLQFLLQARIGAKRYAPGALTRTHHLALRPQSLRRLNLESPARRSRSGRPPHDDHEEGHPEDQPYLPFHHRPVEVVLWAPQITEIFFTPLLLLFLLHPSRLFLYSKAPQDPKASTGRLGQ